MEIKDRAIATAHHPTPWGYNYVDDTHTKLDKQNTQISFTIWLPFEADTKFTTMTIEGEGEGKVDFLDTNIVRHLAAWRLISTESLLTPTIRFTSQVQIKPSITTQAEWTLDTHGLIHMEEEDSVMEIQHVKQATEKCRHPKRILEEICNLPRMHEYHQKDR